MTVKISSISASASNTGPLKAGAVVTFTVGISQPVTVSGLPVLALNDGGLAIYDPVLSQPGGIPANLVFHYTVRQGDSTSDLTVVALNLVGGSIHSDGSLHLNAPTTLNVGSDPVAVVAADVDGDKKTDLVVANYGDGTVSVLLNQTSLLRQTLGLDFKFSAATSFAVGAKTTALAVGDFTGDQLPDLIVTDASSNQVYVLKGDGKGSFTSISHNPTGPGPTSVATGLIDKDNNLDVVVTNSNKTVSTLFGAGTGNFYVPEIYGNGIGSAPESAQLADLDGDGKPDLIEVNSRSNTVSVLLNDGTGTFGTGKTYRTGSGATSVVVADLNGDGKLDMAVTNSNDDTVSVFLGDGHGGFGDAHTFLTGHTPVAVAAADMDGDGKLDLVTADRGGTVSVLVGRGDGTFFAPYSVAAGHSPSAIAVGDFDGDGLTDVAVTNSDDNTVSILRNNSVLAGDLVLSTLYLNASSLDTGFKVDATQATVVARTASPVSGSFGAGAVLTLTLSFSEVVTLAGTGTPVLTLNDGGTATYVSGSGTTDLVFRTTVAAGQNAAALSVTGVTVPSTAAIYDAGGNAADLSHAAGGFGNVAVDTTAPTITADVASPATGKFGTGQVITLTITGSEPLTVTGAPTLLLNDGGTATYVSGSGTARLVFSYSIVKGQNTTNLAVTGKNLPTGASITDLAGNAAVLTGANTVFTGLQIDTTAPVVTSIVANPLAGSFDVGQSITFTLTFSEAVKVGGTVVLTLNDGGTAVFTGKTFQQGGAASTTLVFRTTVAAGQNVAALAVTGVSLAAGASIYGSSGTAYLGSAVASFPAIGVNTTAPAVRSLVAIPGDATLAAGAVVTLNLKLTKPVVVTGGTPTLTLNDGGVATYVSGSGTSTLVFTSTVAPGQATPDLAVTAVNPNGATVADQAGRPANLTGAVGNPAGTLEIGAQAVTVLSFAAVPGATGPLGVGQTVAITATLSRGVTVTTAGGVPTLTLNDGGTAAYDASASTATRLVFRTTIAAGQNAANLAVTGMTLNGGVVKVPDSPLSFTGPASYDTTLYTKGVVIADLNGDGQPDVVVGGDYGDALLLGDGNGGFFPSKGIPGASGIVAVADLNGDGAPDIVTGSLSVLLNDGTGTFTAGTGIAGTDGNGASALALGDLNGDGVPDLVMFDFNEQNILVALGNGAGAFGTAVSYAAPQGLGYGVVLLGDVTGDGKLDVVVGAGAGMTILPGDGRGGFGTATTLVDTGRGQTFWGGVLADLNGDGRLDVVSVVRNRFTVWLSQPGGGFGPSADYLVDANEQIAAGDVNGDGSVDLVVSTFAGGVNVFLNDGTGHFGGATNFGTVQFSTGLAVGDLNADGRPDIVSTANILRTSDDTQTAAVIAMLDTTVGPNVFDPAGAATAAGRVTGLVVDTTAPTIGAVVAGPFRGSLDVGKSIVFTLTASEAVTVTGTPVLTLNDGGTASYIGGSGTGTLQFRTTVAAGQNAATLAVTGVSLPAGATIRDAAGNDAVLGGAAASFGGLSVVTAAPVVLSVVSSQANGTLGAGAVLTLSVVLSKPVSVSRGVPTLTLSSGGTARYISGSGTDTLVFGTTVAGGQATPDLAVTTLNLNGAVIADRSGRAANLAGAAFNPAGTLAIAAPAVTVTGIVATPQSAGPLGAGQVVAFAVTVARPVAVSGAPTLALNDGGTAYFDAAASTATTLVFHTTVTAGQGTPNLSVTAMNLNGATVAVPGSFALGTAAATSTGSTSWAPSTPHLFLDIDRSGIPDDLFVNPARGSVTVGLFDAVQNWENQVDYAVGTNPVSLTLADVNNDGVADLLVANAGSGTVSVLLGQADNGFATGTFAAATTVSVNGGLSTPRSVTVTDADGDGKPDLLVASGTSVFLLRGDGTGGFSDAGPGAPATAVTLADVDGDGKADAVATIGVINQVAVLRGDGSGGFGPATLYAVGSNPRNVTAVDLNRDGRPDLVVSNNSGGTLSVLLGTGGGGFAPATTVAIGGGTSLPGPVAAADVNGDGNLDLLVTTGFAVDVMLGDGAGGFTYGGTFGAGSDITGVAATDVNGDGRPDLVVLDAGDTSDPAGASSSVSVLLADGSGGFGPAASYAAGNLPVSLTAADVDGDGRADLVIANAFGGDVSVLLGNGFGGFLPAVNYAAGVTPTGAVAADVNGDGKLDLVVSGIGHAYVLLGDGTGAFGPAIPYATGNSLVGAVAAADLDGDGKPDLVAASATGNLYTLLNGSSAPGVFTTAGTSAAPGAVTGLAVDTGSVACYVGGTAILTDRGEVAVEALAIGDLVVTASGRHRPIRWLGRRSYSGRFLAGNPAVQPVRIRAGALGGGLPRRDLFVSPEHAMVLDGVLVAARLLVNGCTVLRDSRPGRVDYHHVELDSHDVLLAEGAPSESYLDDDSRAMFQNAPEFEALYPQGGTGGRFCARRVESGPELECIRQRIGRSAVGQPAFA